MTLLAELPDQATKAIEDFRDSCKTGKGRTVAREVSCYADQAIQYLDHEGLEQVQKALQNLFETSGEHQVSFEQSATEDLRLHLTALSRSSKNLDESKISPIVANAQRKLYKESITLWENRIVKAGNSMLAGAQEYIAKVQMLPIGQDLDKHAKEVFKNAGENSMAAFALSLAKGPKNGINAADAQKKSETAHAPALEPEARNIEDLEQEAENNRLQMNIGTAEEGLEEQTIHLEQYIALRKQLSALYERYQAAEAALICLQQAKLEIKKHCAALKGIPYPVRVIAEAAGKLAGLQQKQRT